MIRRIAIGGLTAAVLGCLAAQAQETIPELEGGPGSHALQKVEAKPPAPVKKTVTQTAVARAKSQAEARAKAEAEAQAKAQAEAQAKAQAEAQVKALAQAQALAKVQAKALVQAKAQAEAQVEAQAHALAKAQAEADLAQAQAQADALTVKEERGRLAQQAEAQKAEQVRLADRAENLKAEQARLDARSAELAAEEARLTKAQAEAALERPKLPERGRFEIDASDRQDTGAARGGQSGDDPPSPTRRRGHIPVDEGATNADPHLGTSETQSPRTVEAHFDMDAARSSCARAGENAAQARNYYSARYERDPRVDPSRGWELRGLMRLENRRGYVLVDTLCSVNETGEAQRFVFLR